MNAFLAIARKDLKLLLRDRLGLFWVLGFPLVYALFFGSIFGGMGGEGGAGSMNVAAVDHDQTPSSTDFLKALEDSAAITLKPMSLEAAQEAVRKGNIPAYVLVRSGFGSNPFALFAGGSNGESVLEVGVDPSRSAEKGMLQGVIMESAFRSLRTSFATPEKLREQIAIGRRDIRQTDGLAPAQKLVFDTFMGALDSFIGSMDPELYAQGPFGGSTESPAASADQADARADNAGPSMGRVEFVDVTRQAGLAPRTSFEISFPQSILWGVMGCAAGFAISLVVERTRGTLTRLRLAPISLAHILAGKALACFTTVCAVVTLLLALGILMFRVGVGNYFHLSMAVASIALCFTGIMMMMSVIGTTEASVSGAGWAVNTIFAMIGGAMVPLFVMPAWMQKISILSPVSWSIKSLEGAIWRNFTLQEMLLHAGILSAVGTITFFTGTLIAAKRQT